MGIKIIFGGDFCVTPAYTSSHIYSEELLKFFEQSDINIINLECPVINDDNNDKILKTGPHLHTNYKVYDLLKELNIHAVTLANNHILDYGSKGLISTIQGCINNDIITTGAGENLRAASEPAIIEKKGIRIALVNFCEHEFSIATEKSPGANPLDLIDKIKDIKIARNIADFVFVIIHGGHEHYNFPSPRMVKQYRFIAENGADAIIGHHSHCISGFEIYNNVPIFYGLGNLLFTSPCKNEGWNNGLLVQFEAKKGYPLKWNLMPTEQSTENYQLKLCSGEEKNRIIQEVQQYSNIITNNNALNEKWISFAKMMESQILNDFSPINIMPGTYFRAILRKLGLNNIIFRKGYVMPILNSIECESLYDLSQFILNSKKQ